MLAARGRRSIVLIGPYRVLTKKYSYTMMIIVYEYCPMRSSNNGMKFSKETARADARPARTADIAPPWHGVPTAIARRFHQICVAKTAAVVGEAGLTPLQYGTLLYLSKLTGKPGIEQTSLANRLNVDRNTASLLVEQ